MKTVALVPIKMNNERTPGKNTKSLYDGKPLIQLILSTLLECNEIDGIYVYCSKEEIRDYILPGIRYLKRDEKYDTADADVVDMFFSFSQEISADIYVLAHATAPFLKSESVDAAVQILKEGTYDSVTAVRKMQEFIWKDRVPMNFEENSVPRTQDLPPLYVETTGLYAFTKHVIQNKHSRIGYNPYLLEVSQLEATDINNPIDFTIADAVYKYMKDSEAEKSANDKCRRS